MCFSMSVSLNSSGGFFFYSNFIVSRLQSFPLYHGYYFKKIVTLTRMKFIFSMAMVGLACYTLESIYCLLFVVCCMQCSAIYRYTSDWHHIPIYRLQTNIIIMIWLALFLIICICEKVKKRLLSSKDGTHVYVYRAR